MSILHQIPREIKNYLFWGPRNTIRIPAGVRCNPNCKTIDMFNHHLCMLRALNLTLSYCECANDDCVCFIELEDDIAVHYSYSELCENCVGH